MAEATIATTTTGITTPKTIPTVLIELDNALGLVVWRGSSSFKATALLAMTGTPNTFGSDSTSLSINVVREIAYSAVSTVKEPFTMTEPLQID